MTDKEKSSNKISKGIVARIFILFLTAFIGLGFIYTMLYKGIVYEALFGDEGYFSKFDSTPSPTLKIASPTVAVTPTPTATAGETNEPAESEVTSPAETAEPSEEPASDFEPLKKGMENQKVRELQTLLTKKGYMSYEHITGYFGPITENAVKKFQQENGLPVTGIVDEETMEKIKAAEDVI